MNDERALATTDASRMHTWLEGVGANLMIGHAELKSVKISKNGKKLTLVIKNKAKKQKIQSQPVA